MEEAPENGKESSNSAHADGMNEYNTIIHTTVLQLPTVFNTVTGAIGYTI